jgi:putative SOS response-associated peptidase YedK
MCGRYTQTASPENLIFRFGLDETAFAPPPRFNLAPGQEAPIVVNEGKKILRKMQWGLVPSWAKDPSIGSRMINARAETLLEKPSFRRLIGKKRCLVLADGFYEWKKIHQGKVPMRFVLKNGEPFAFAGLWDVWSKPDGSKIQSFTIITTAANSLLKTVHERMPVILKDVDEDKWLDFDLNDPPSLMSLLRPFDSECMEGYEVSTLVNSPKNDSPQCVLRN